MKYQVGDVVVIRSDLKIDNEYSAPDGFGTVRYTQNKHDFVVDHNYIVTIEEIYSDAYAMVGLSRSDNRKWAFYDSMICGLYEDLSCSQISECDLAAILEV